MSSPWADLFLLAAKTISFHSGILKKIASLRGLNHRLLAFERIIDPEKLPYPIASNRYITPEHFENLLRWVARHMTVMPLEDLIEARSHNHKINPLTVSLILEGAYLEHYFIALPIIQELKLPVTIFPATAYLGTAEMLWQDKLALALLTCFRSRKKILRDLSEQGLTKDKVDPTRDLLFRLLEKESDNDFYLALDELTEALAQSSPENRFIILGLYGELARNYAELKSDVTFMSWQHLTELSNNHVTIGLSTHTFRPLVELGTDDLPKEIEHTLNTLREHKLYANNSFLPPQGKIQVRFNQAIRDAGVAAILYHQNQQYNLRECVCVPVLHCSEASNFSPRELLEDGWLSRKRGSI
ncbi:polysaccharide deacetylase family protein [bacterium]|nr:polysaccharide deacetylase family protein [bacterium]